MRIHSRGDTNSAPRSVYALNNADDTNTRLTGNTANEIDALLLDALVAVLKHGSQARQQIANRWLHLAHSHNIHNGLER